MSAVSAYLASQIWSMAPDHFAKFRASLESIEVLMAKGLRTKDKYERYYAGESMLHTHEDGDGVHHIHLNGPLLSDIQDWMHLFGDMVDLAELHEHLGSLHARDDIHTVHLHINSPGGSVVGAYEVHEALKSLQASGKKVLADGFGLMASAAYLLACNADSVRATTGTVVGAIGVYSVLEDTSEMLAKYGVKLTLVSSGGIKGAGADGKVTPELIAETKRLVDGYAAKFESAVAEGRGLDASVVKNYADGRVWLAPEAVKLDLIDDLYSGYDTDPGDDELGGEDGGYGDGLTTERHDGIGTDETHAEHDKINIVSGSASQEMETGNIPAQSVPAKVNNMTTPAIQVSPTALCDLVAAFPKHAAEISTMAKAGNTSAAIVAEVMKKNQAEREAELVQLRADVAAALKAQGEEKAAHEAALKAEKEAHAATQAKLAAISALGKGAATDPGQAHAEGNSNRGTASKEIKPADAWRAEYDASDELQSIFELTGGFAAFAALKRSEQLGQDPFNRKTRSPDLSKN